GACGEVAALNAQRKGERWQGLRGVERAAGRENVNHGHIGESEDQAEQHGHANDGPHHGNHDLELRAPESGAIDCGGFGNILGNGGAPGEEDDGGEGHQAPTVHQKHGSDGQSGFAEPHGSVEGLIKVQRHKNPANHAVDGIEDPFPADGAEGDGGDPRQKNQKADQAAAAKGVFQRNGQNVGAHDDHDLRADGENEGIADGDAKAGALQDAAEIFETDEMHFSVADAGVAKGVKDGEKKWTANQQEDIEQR